MIKVSENERENIRLTLSQIAGELKTKNPRASSDEISRWLKNLLDVTV